MAHSVPTKESFWPFFERHRGSVDAGDLLTAIAAFIVLRWADQLEAHQEAVASSNGAPFSPTLAPGSRWRDFCDLYGPDLSRALATEVAPVIRRCHSVGPGALVRRIDLEYLIRALSRSETRALDSLVGLVRSLPLVTRDDREQVLDVFDDALTRFGDPHGILRESATPRAVVELVVGIASPEQGERIYDPCFGVAAMLAACARHVHKRSMRRPSKRSIDLHQGAFVGVELKATAFTIGMARLILAGVDEPDLSLGNTLARLLPRDRVAEGFDCIVSDPPFGGKLDADVARQFPVAATSSEALFLQHIMGSLRPGGRAVVVLPQGAFFRGGPDAEVRRLLLEKYHVEAVISLPAGTYLPYSGVKTGVLVLRRDPPGTHVRFVDAGRPNRRENGEADTRAPLFDPIAVAASARGQSEAYDVRVVPIDELKRDGATFVPARQDSPFLTFVKAIREADASVPIHALDQVAEIFTGFRHVAKELLDRRQGVSGLGYLRVSEVADGDTKPPVRFLTPEAAKDVPAERRLRLGDVVVTRSGSIGRVALIANGAIGCVAAMGLFVLRPRTDSISPHYLAAILRSAPIRAWMLDQARGLTVRHVLVSELRRLEIPVPEPILQDRIVHTLQNEGGDASALLLRALTSGNEETVGSWLEASEAVQGLLTMRDGARPEQEIIDAVEDIAHEIHAVRTRLGDYPNESSHTLRAWADDTASAIAPLINVRDVPLGGDRLAVYEMACRRLHRVLDVLLAESPSPPAAVLASELSRTLIALLDTLIERCAGSFKLAPLLEPVSVDAGISTAVTLRVRNEGPTAVRDVVLRSRDPLLGSGPAALGFQGNVRYLDAGQDLSITIAFLAPPLPGSVGFEVAWTMRQLDGRQISGSFPLVINVRVMPEGTPTPDLGTSPYIVGSPIDRPEMLYGRDGILSDIKRQLAMDHRANIVLLEGNRRTGKTSILKRLEKPGEIPGWIAVNTSLQGAEGSGGRAGVTSKEIFRLLARDLALAVSRAGVPVWLPDAPPPDPRRHYELQLRSALTAYFDGDHPFETFEIYLKAVLDAVAPRRVLLMLDEFDKIQEGIDAGVTSPQVPENLRYLFHTYPQLGGILSGSRRLTKLRNDYWSVLFGIGYAIRVGPLAVEDGRALVTNPVAGRIFYVPAARDRIVDLCACQPFLIQTLCNRIFKDAYERNERTVMLDAVERAANEMTGDNEHFETLWGYARTDRRRLLLALLCELVRGSDGRPLDAGTLEDELAERGVAVPENGLGEDITHLRELELVDLETYDGYQRYRLSIPLMAEWIRRNKDFSDLARRAISAENDGRD